LRGKITDVTAGFDVIALRPAPEDTKTAEVWRRMGRRQTGNM
jgi:hypothetical protein